MAYLTESQVRQAARADSRVIMKSMDSAAVLAESVEKVALNATFDVFLCHSIRDAELVQGAKSILEKQGLTVYVDWIVDPQMDRTAVTPATAGALRARLERCGCLLYLFSNNSKRSRWMPWELGFFDGHDGSVAVLPIAPDAGGIDFGQEEYLGLYPKVELEKANLFVNRTAAKPVAGDDKANYRGLKEWMNGSEKLRL
jgi:hypothetical protein